MEIKHRKEENRFYTEVEGFTGYVEYRIHDGGLDIVHTIVPDEIGGRGIAAELVAATYEYARSQGLKPIATCSYAIAWLERHPKY